MVVYFMSHAFKTLYLKHNLIRPIRTQILRQSHHIDPYLIEKCPFPCMLFLNPPPPHPPFRTQGPGKFGALRERNVVIFGTSRAKETSQLPHASTLSHVDFLMYTGPLWQLDLAVSSPSQPSLNKWNTQLIDLSQETETIRRRLTCHSSPGILLK